MKDIQYILRDVILFLSDLFTGIIKNPIRVIENGILNKRDRDDSSVYKEFRFSQEQLS